MSSNRTSSPDLSAAAPSDFVRDLVRADVKAAKNGGRVVTRFPPEPNGFLHIGHAKAICIDFGIAAEFGGRCHLRMDDTNPTTEDMAYVESIQRDVKWLGFSWGEHMYYASDYFERFYELGETLIRFGRAYVCDLSDDDFAQNYRGTITEAGKESPYRARSVEENLDLFRRMRKGEFKDGERVLRARIDMSSPNMKMRDPPLVRIKHAHHYRTKDVWCIYPLYDFAHCLEDSFEGVTHSLCTLEFESARELYDWVLSATEVAHVPKQIEFARLNLTYTVMSKRKLLQLVEGKHVAGWDDPRMPTIAGLRRRGVTPEAIRAFCAKIGVAKNISTVDVALLEHTVREDLDGRSPRVMAVEKPLEVIVESFPEGEVETFDAPYWPPGTTPSEGVETGTRPLPFTRRLFIERDDFAEVPPAGWHRLAPGAQVRLRHAYIVTCTSVEKNAAGEITAVRVAHDPATRGGVAPAGAKNVGTIHWVSADESIDGEVRIYDRLFSVESPGSDGADWLTELNPNSLTVRRAKLEPSLKGAKKGDRFQFERLGFFVVDADSASGALIFNRTVALKDGWAKVVAKGGKGDGRDKGAPKEAPKAREAKAAAQAPVPAELPADAKKLVDTHGISAQEARVLVQEAALLAIFDDVAANFADAKRGVASLLVNEVLGELRTRKLAAPPFAAKEAAELVGLLVDGTLSTKQVKDVLAEMFDKGGTPKAIAAARGMQQIASEDALAPAVDAVLAENADAVGRYRAGNANVFGALVGLVMKKTGGQANPKLVSELLKKKLA